jgi:acylphosphatase
MPQESKALRALVRGRVQGVGFRYSALRQARSLGIRGTVANMPDGSVEVLAEGEEARLALFLRWLEKGPPGAHVAEVQVEALPVSGRYLDFEIAF